MCPSAFLSSVIFLISCIILRISYRFEMVLNSIIVKWSEDRRSHYFVIVGADFWYLAKGQKLVNSDGRLLDSVVIIHTEQLFPAIIILVLIIFRLVSVLKRP